MKLISVIGSIALALSLTACGGTPEKNSQNPSQKSEAKPATKPATKGPMDKQQIEEFKVSFEKAMGDIPPELREDFQKVFNCEIVKNNKLPADKQRNIDGAAVREMTAALKKDRSIANCG